MTNITRTTARLGADRGQVLVVIVYNLWKATNATTTVDRAWPGVRLYMSFMERNFTISPNTGSAWGDWQAPGDTPRIACDLRYGIPQTEVRHCPTDAVLHLRTITHITAATAIVMNHMQIAELAQATGRVAEAETYGRLAETMKAEYHRSFYNAAAKTYGDGTSTAFACALWLGVTPQPLLEAVVENFVTHLASMNYRVVGVGFIGVRYVFEVSAALCLLAAPGLACGP